MTPQEELAALNELKSLEDAKAAHAVPQAPEKGFMDKLSDMIPDSVKNVGTAMYKGAAGLAAGAADALAAQPDFRDAIAAGMGEKRTFDPNGPVSVALEKSGYQPKTQAEKYVNMGIRGATSALTGPGAITGPGRAIVSGLSSGLVGEAAGQLPGIAGTSSEGVARVAGALAGGFGGGLATAPFKNSKALTQEAFAGLTPDELDKAKILMMQASKAGVPVNLDQALGRDSNISNMIKTLVSRKEGQPIVDQLRDQPAQVKTLADRLTQILPGTVKERAAIANETQGAATDVMQKIRKQRTDAVRPFYQASGEVPADVAQTLYSKVKQAAADAPDTNKGDLLEDIATVVQKAMKRQEQPASTILGADGKPLQASAAGPLNMEQLNDSLRTFTTGLKNVTTNSKAGDKEAVGAALSMVKSIRDTLGEASPNFKAGNDLYSKMSAELVDPMKKGVIGRVAGATGAVADKEAMDKFLPILARGRDPKANTSEIVKFAQETKDTPAIFQNAVKTNFSNAVADAEGQVNGQLAPSLPAALERTLLGDASKRQGLKDQLEQLAIHQGLPKNAIYPGFLASLKVLSAAAKRPSGIGPDAKTLDEIAGQSTVAPAMHMLTMNPGRPAAQGLTNWLTADAYRKLAENLTCMAARPTASEMRPP